MDFIKYTIWPRMKVILIYWWWIIKYRGKKNIPPEVFFRRMIKNIEGMKENLEKAFLLGKDDMSKEEFLEFYNTMGKVEGFKEKVTELKQNKN